MSKKRYTKKFKILLLISIVVLSSGVFFVSNYNYEKVQYTLAKTSFKKDDLGQYTIKEDTEQLSVPINTLGTSELFKIPQEQESSQVLAVFPECRVDGCGGELCVDADSKDIVSNCQYKAEYDCYNDAICEVQVSTGHCGWTDTLALQMCIINNGPSPTPTPTPTPIQGNTLLVPQNYATINAAISAASAGDSIIVQSTYTANERINLTKSGLTIQAQQGVTMQGFLIQASNTTISGFTITTLSSDMQDGTGIWGESGSNNVIEYNSFLYNTWGGLHTESTVVSPDQTSYWTIRSNRFVRNGMFGAEIQGQNHLFETNEISDTIQHHPCSGSSATWLDADGVRFHGDGHLFRYNYIHDLNFGPASYTTGIACSLENLQNYTYDFVDDSHTDCFQTYQSTDGKRSGTNIIFKKNICDLPPAGEWTATGVGAKAFQGSGDMHDITITNNIIIADFGSLFEEADGDMPHGIYIYHNTFVGSNHPSSTGLRFVGATAPVIVKNNIFAWHDNGLTHLYDPNTIVTQDYNCVWRRDGEVSPGVHDVNQNPLFQDPAEDDYQLTYNSPCIDAGTNVGVLQDILGDTRPRGAGYDMGAYEY